MQIKVSDVFHTSLGMIANLNFPEGTIPKLNMVLKKGELSFLIKAISFNQPNKLEIINNTSYSCLLSFSHGSIEPGDILELESNVV